MSPRDTPLPDPIQTIGDALVKHCTDLGVDADAFRPYGAADLVLAGLREAGLLPADTRCASRVASEFGTVVRCMLFAGHPAPIRHYAPAVGEWNDDDDRLITDQ